MRKRFNTVFCWLAMLAMGAQTVGAYDIPHNKITGGSPRTAKWTFLWAPGTTTLALDSSFTVAGTLGAGAFSTTGLTISGATPSIVFKDTDAAVALSDLSIVGNVTDTGTSTRDATIIFNQYINGTNTAWLTAVGGGDITFGSGRAVIASGGGSLTGTWSDHGTVTTMDLNGGTIDGAVIGGAVPAAGTFTAVAATTSLATPLLTLATNVGVDGAGVDFQLFTDTPGEECLWDASENKLALDGTNGANVLEVTDGNVSFTDNLSVGGTTTVGSTFTTQGPSVTTSGCGMVVSVTGLSGVEYGNSVVHKTVLTLTNVTVPITRKAGDSSGYGGIKVYTFPEGWIQPICSHGNLTNVDVSVTYDTAGNISDTGSGKWAVGQVVPADHPLGGSSDAKILNDGSGNGLVLTDPLVGGIGVGTPRARMAADFTAAEWDGSATAKEVWVNLEFDAGDVTTGDSSAGISAVVTIEWSLAGDD